MSCDQSNSLPGVQKFLLFSSQMAVRGIPFNLSSQEDVIIPITGVPSYFVGIDFDAQDNSIFYSDTVKDMIFKQKVDGTGNGVFYTVLNTVLVLLSKEVAKTTHLIH